MTEISSRVLFPSALFRFTDNSVIVQLVQTDEHGNAAIIAENSFAKLVDAIDYYKEFCANRKAKYEESIKKKPKEEEEEQKSEESLIGD